MTCGANSSYALADYVRQSAIDVGQYPGYEIPDKSVGWVLTQQKQIKQKIKCWVTLHSTQPTIERNKINIERF